MGKIKDEMIILMERYKNIDNIVDVINEVDTCLYVIEQSIARFELLLEHTSQNVIHEAFKDGNYIDIVRLLQGISNAITDYYEE